MSGLKGQTTSLQSGDVAGERRMNYEENREVRRSGGTRGGQGGAALSSSRGRGRRPHSSPGDVRVFDRGIPVQEPSNRVDMAEPVEELNGSEQLRGDSHTYPCGGFDNRRGNRRGYDSGRGRDVGGLRNRGTDSITDQRRSEDTESRYVGSEREPFVSSRDGILRRENQVNDTQQQPAASGDVRAETRYENSHENQSDRRGGNRRNNDTRPGSRLRGNWRRSNEQQQPPSSESDSSQKSKFPSAGQSKPPGMGRRMDLEHLKDIKERINIPQLVQELEVKLTTGKTECMICYENVGRKSSHRCRWFGIRDSRVRAPMPMAEWSNLTMDKFVIRGAGPSSPSVKQLLVSRKRWQAGAYQVDGKLPAAYKHSLLNAMLLSYSEIGSFPQSNLSRDFPPPVHAPIWQGSVVDTLSSFTEIVGMASGNTFFTSRPIVTCVEFDAQGVYVASVSSNGCLSIHDFETLYCNSGGCGADSVKPTVHLHTRHKLEAMRWNPNNQDEVACVASGSSSVYIYDIGSFSEVPRQTLQFKPSPQRGQPPSLFDLSYSTIDKDRMIACGNDNNVRVWDRRLGKFPTMSLPAPTGGGDLNTLQLSRDEHLVLAGSEGGLIVLWDLRGGRNSAAFVTAGEVYHPPLRSIQVAKLLEDIPDLKAQTKIENSSVHSISLNPSSGHHLGFHLNNGWSGVLDLLDFSVSHVHCPPPSWLDHECAPWLTVRRRRPAWLTSYPVYAVGCMMECQINVLDFTPGPKSQCSVNSNRQPEHANVDEKWKKELHTSEPVVAIASHPTNDYLLAGTQAGSLLLIGQKKKSALTKEEALKLSTQATAGYRNALVDVSEFLEIRASGQFTTR